ncbi:hypothetical protein JXJ21_12155 [candidate division KSB1 bacterium]|nr:hypothetical protein [candidate division KSB1 bacterium]
MINKKFSSQMYPILCKLLASASSTIWMMTRCRDTAAVNQAVLSVHLLNEWPGKSVIDNKTVTYPQRQLELGLKCATSQVIWIPKQLDINQIENKYYGDFLARLENDAQQAKRYHFIRGTHTNTSELNFTALEAAP